MYMLFVTYCSLVYENSHTVRAGEGSGMNSAGVRRGQPAGFRDEKANSSALGLSPVLNMQSELCQQSTSETMRPAKYFWLSFSLSHTGIRTQTHTVWCVHTDKPMLIIIFVQLSQLLDKNTTNYLFVISNLD